MRHTFVTLIFVAAAAAALRATVLIPADLGELSRDARAIARGRVIAVEGRWTVDRRTIETVVTLEAETYLKGSLGETVQFRVPGGWLGRYRNIVVGAPQFTVGQRVIVFLGARGPSVPFVLGLSQGVFRVTAGGDGQTMVLPPAVLPTASGPVVRGSVSRRAAPLDAFEHEVRVLAAGVQ